ncbi:response regulator [Donghicola tyrosinivorans]|uniref:Twitching motility two-component system response regulator PilH n=1 Tax=Donghicola tyrosinivorans TaxID=1652492 RepID=A0A2T0WNH0_9RHOB|nr:response regulator [Donghicola tyrosinivorans]PRY88235.1 twitching motility two-component system response regulator PilH [Donghicola tyrosinivorans]
MARILWCDDDPMYSVALSAILGDWGHRVLLAESAAEALKVLEAEPVDLAILDVVMPGGGGVSLLHRIKDIYPRLPTVICTGRDFLFETPLMEIGLSKADVKIKKDISPEDLFDVINQLLVAYGS